MKQAGNRLSILLSDRDPAAFRRDALLHAPHDYFMLLDNPDGGDSSFQWLMAIGLQEELVLSAEASHFPEELKTSMNELRDWCFGFVSYELKNILEYGLDSQQEDICPVPLLHFFVPQCVIMFDGQELWAYYCKGFAVPEWGKSAETEIPQPLLPIFLPVINKQEYVTRVEHLKQHILRGDIYEINFCTEWRSSQFITDAPCVYYHQQKRMQAPSSVFLRLGDAEVICHSPERFLKKQGSRILSQPIKGTAPRSAEPEMDKKYLESLSTEKERSENVMIVDLVRNDLAKVARKGTVQVEELFGKYTFPQVHQMISTLSCELNEGLGFFDILQALFPMGSMTGAPKISAMQLAGQMEPMSRGLYSGSIGYFGPDGDFDFNVVIRSIQQSRSAQHAVIRAGSAITWEAVPEHEWEECSWKIKGLLMV
jgi:para-aminobenzoate synthetase component I